MNALQAMGITLLAGLATGIGSIVVFSARKTGYRFLAIATGFSAGMMLYVSFVEIFFKGLGALSERFGACYGNWVNAASFFGGILLIGLIDNIMPSRGNPHEFYSQEETKKLGEPAAKAPALRARYSKDCGAPEREYANSGGRRALLRTGIFTALAIGIHNFPEGLATFLSALKDPKLGIAIAVAIALHNIPEGISVAVPIFYATNSRRKAFTYSFLSGLAEPVGAGIGYIALRLFVGEDGAIPAQAMGIMFGGVAGIMVYISLDELLPASRAYGRGHDSILGLVAGMLLMALTLLLMQ